MEDDTSIPTKDSGNISLFIIMPGDIEDRFPGKSLIIYIIVINKYCVHANLARLLDLLHVGSIYAVSSQAPTLSPLAHLPLTSISIVSSSSYVITYNGAFAFGAESGAGAGARAGAFTGVAPFIGRTTGILKSV